jgi:hypothetical protein
MLAKALSAARKGTESLEMFLAQHDLTVEVSLKPVMSQLRKCADRVDTGEPA